MCGKQEGEGDLAQARFSQESTLQNTRESTLRILVRPSIGVVRRVWSVKGPIPPHCIYACSGRKCSHFGERRSPSLSLRRRSVRRRVGQTQSSLGPKFPSHDSPHASPRRRQGAVIQVNPHFPSLPLASLVCNEPTVCMNPWPLKLKMRLSLSLCEGGRTISSTALTVKKNGHFHFHEF